MLKVSSIDTVLSGAMIGMVLGAFSLYPPTSKIIARKQMIMPHFSF
jgi:hypothetical protein